VELISETMSLYDMRRCGNNYFRLWCVYCVPCCVQSYTIRHAVHSLKYLLTQRRISY